MRLGAVNTTSFELSARIAQPMMATPLIARSCQPSGSGKDFPGALLQPRGHAPIRSDATSPDSRHHGLRYGDKTPQQLTLEVEHWTERAARGQYDEATPTPTPGPVTLTFTPMSKEVQEKIDTEKSAKEKTERERFNKQEAEREARGDFSQAPGLTPEQKETAETRWAEKNAEENIKNAKPAPQ